MLVRYKSKWEKVGVLPIRRVKSVVSSVGPSSERKCYVSQSPVLFPKFISSRKMVM